MTRTLDRRELVATLAGAGLWILFPLDPLAAQEPERIPARPSYPTDPNAYLHVGENGRITCFVGKVELGQGAKTALSQLCAEELDAPLDSIDLVMGDTELCPWDMGTFGSLTIRSFGPVLRAAIAEARAALMSLAAEELKVPAESLVTRDGAVADPSGRSVTYGRLVKGKRIERRLKAVPKPFGAYRVIGTSPRRRDALEKVTGRAVYAADVTAEGMLHARILRPPAHGAALKELDTSPAESVPGARVIRAGDLVAVLHERPDEAERALGLVKARFEEPPALIDDSSIFDHLVKAAPPARLAASGGSLEEGEKLAASIHAATYLNAYVAHAPIETHAALAKLEDGKVTVWASTQAPFMVRGQVAEALGLPPEKVRVIATYVGGGFGGKSGGPQAVEAARLAKAAGRPVRVMWDRSEEFFFDTFRPASVVTIRAGITAEGKLSSWDYAVVGAGDREAKSFYDAPHHRTLSSGGWQGEQPAGLHPFAVGPWRAPSVNTNTFAREVHIDALAAKAHLDPLAFRLRNLSDPRMVRVLRAAAEKFGWKEAVAPSGRGHGIACAAYGGTYVAACAEVAVGKATGRVRVLRVVCAQDMGLVVNPDGARQQIEGSVTMGLGYALTEEVRFRGGRVLDANFDTYEIPRFSWLPEIETVLVENRETPASGCGEPPIVCMGAVIANAIADATGARLTHLPMTPDRVKRALAG